jgi:hypothetical protein
MYYGERMRRFLSALVLASVLVTAFPSTIPATFGQRAAEKSKKAAVAVTAQRGLDTISASQMKDYLTFIASDEMEGRDTPSRGLSSDESLALGFQACRRQRHFLSAH